MPKGAVSGTKLKFRVLPEAGDLMIGKHVFKVGPHEEELDEATARAVASAEAAGGVEIDSGKPPRDHIESDEESLKVYDKNLSNTQTVKLPGGRNEEVVVGEWQRGNLQNHIAELQAAIRISEEMLDRDEVYGIVPDHRLGLPEDASDKDRDKATRDVLEQNIALAKSMIADAEGRLERLPKD